VICFQASEIHFEISLDWLNPEALQMAFSFFASAKSSLTVTDFKGLERGLRPAPFRFPPALMMRV
jgi:hypothetical protein